MAMRRGLAVCWACAARETKTTAAPSPAMKMRRFMRSPRGALVRLFPVIVLHRLPGDFLQESCGRGVDAVEIGIADRRFAGQRREHHAGGKVGAGKARMALVR